MKYLIILGLIFFLLLLVYLRLRPFFRMARQVFGFARDVRRVTRDGFDAASTESRATGDRLTRCESCGTWIPESRAVKLRSSNASYCSHTCLETTAGGSERKAAGSRL